MAERRLRGGRKSDQPVLRDEEFTPTATMVLMLGYITTFATLWGLIYYLQLLARR